MSTTLFATLGVSKILASPDSHSVEYALAIFCFIAFFLIAATMMVRQSTPSGHAFGFVGLGFFALVGAACTAEMIAQNHLTPVIVLTERVQPDMAAFRDPDADQPVKLAVMYYPPGGAGMVPFKSGTQKVKNDDIIEIVYGGVSELAQKYLQALKRQKLLNDELGLACRNARSKDICTMAAERMEAPI